MNTLELEQILSPELVEAYLRRSGWTEPQPRSATFATFRRGVAWIDVPVCAEHFAYPRRFRELMAKLSRLESRPVAAILDDIAAATLRVIEGCAELETIDCVECIRIAEEDGDILPPACEKHGGKPH